MKKTLMMASLVCVVALSVGAGQADAVFIDFDSHASTSITSGTPAATAVVTDDYLGSGIVFGKAGVSAGVAVVSFLSEFSSSPNSIAGLDAAGSIPASFTGDIYFNFTSGGVDAVTDQLSFDVGDTGGDIDILDIHVYGHGGNLLETRPFSQSSFTNEIFSYPGINSVHIEWTTTSTAGYWVDNISYNTPIPVPEPTTVLFDIKPGSFPNSINLKSKGMLPVAIFGTADFDVNDVDISTLLFGNLNGGIAVSPLRSALEDVSGDGLLDLTLKFSTAELVANGALGLDTIEGLLTGALLDGTPFEGLDSIRIVPRNKSNGNGFRISTVPEPTTCTLALAALCLAISRRRTH